MFREYPIFESGDWVIQRGFGFSFWGFWGFRQKHQRYYHRINLSWSLFSGDDVWLWQNQWGWWFCRNLISWFPPILCFGRNFDVDIRHLCITTDCFWKFIINLARKQCHLNSVFIGLNCHASQMSRDISYFPHLPSDRRQFEGIIGLTNIFWHVAPPL